MGNNSSKNKGDRNELAAVRMLLEAAPDLCRPNAQRMLGAGRREDVGDLYVFPDAAVQVKAMANLGAALRQSAAGAVRQAENGMVPFALGLVPVPRAREGSVRWLAAVSEWPGEDDSLPEVVEFGLVSKLIVWIRDDEGPHGYLALPRERRIAWLTGSGAPPIYVAPLEAWLPAYRGASRELQRYSPGTATPLSA